jgi:hypothetical protein
MEQYMVNMTDKHEAMRLVDCLWQATLFNPDPASRWELQDLMKDIPPDPLDEEWEFFLANLPGLISYLERSLQQALESSR